MEYTHYYLGFSMVDGIGPVRLARLIAFCGSVEAAWLASASQLAAAGLEPKLIAALQAARRHLDLQAELQRLAEAAVEPICLEDRRYPRLLAQIPAAPPILYVRGTLTPADDLALAVVGTRSPSSYGREACSRLVAAFSGAGLTIVSGLALGVDALAHQTALQHGGRTIAVMASGVDLVYPERNRPLAERILDGQGALVSEFPLGTAPTPQLFPVRNRLISGLSLATLVIEAGLQSGALITARYASEQGRDVFAVPGSIFSRTAAGTNALIRDGAGLVSEPRDLLEALNLHLAAPAAGASAAQPQQLSLLEDPLEARIRALLSPEPRHIDELSRACNLPAGQVSATLVLLELRGLARQLPGMQWVAV